MTTNEFTTEDFTAVDMDGATSQLSTIDNVDSVTVGIDVRDTGIRLSLGVRLAPTDTVLMRDWLDAVITRRGW